MFIRIISELIACSGSEKYILKIDAQSTYNQILSLAS